MSRCFSSAKPETKGKEISPAASNLFWDRWQKTIFCGGLLLSWKEIGSGNKRSVRRRRCRSFAAAHPRTPLLMTPVLTDKIPPVFLKQFHVVVRVLQNTSNCHLEVLARNLYAIWQKISRRQTYNSKGRKVGTPRNDRIIRILQKPNGCQKGGQSSVLWRAVTKIIKVLC